MQKYDNQQPLPTFRPISIVAKRSPISATAELLSVYDLQFMLKRLTGPLATVNHISHSDVHCESKKVPP